MLSIIIPTLNEARALPALLDWLLRHVDLQQDEIIVADGRSPDGTAQAVQPPVRLVQGTDSNRAALMNLGAEQARGEVLLFLHADTYPPPDFATRIRRALANPEVVGGAFDHQFTESGWALQLIRRINQVRMAIDPAYYGDQGIFVRRSAFRRLGGFRRRPLMEDAQFCRRLASLGRLVLIRAPARTSGRRFLENGPIVPFALMVLCIILDYTDLLHWDVLAGVPSRRVRPVEAVR